MRLNVYGQQEVIDNLYNSVMINKDYTDKYAETVAECISVYKLIITYDGENQHQNILGYIKQSVTSKERYPAAVNLLFQDIIDILTDAEHKPNIDKYSFLEITKYSYKVFLPLDLKTNYKVYNPVLIDELEIILKKYGIIGLVTILKYFKLIDGMRKP